MITFTRCAFIAKQACATFSQVVQKITPPIANNFLKFFFALFAMLALGAATAWAEDYSIKFLTNTSDGSNEITSSTRTVTVLESASCSNVSGFTNNCIKAYYKGKSGVKLSSGSASGTLELTLSDVCNKNVSKVVFKTAKYNSESSTLTFYAGTSKLGTVAAGNEFSYTFTEPQSISTLKISSTKRAYVSEITISVNSAVTPESGTGKTATYTVSSATAVTATGNIPQGSTATLSGTGSLNGGFIQCTNGKNHTLTLTGYEGYKITGVTIHVKSNSSKGTGSFSVVAGSKTIANVVESAFNSTNWNGSWNNSGVDKVLTMTDNSYEIKTGENVKLTINCKSGSSDYNSLYIKSYTITYEPVSSTSEPENPTANYTIKHYLQNILDDNYTLKDTKTLSGEVGTEVTPSVESYEGFTAPSTQTVTIASDGSTVVEYKYTRNSYKLTWDLDGGTITTVGTTAGSVKYGATIIAPTVTKDGCQFKNWNPSVPATMPADDATYTAQWSKLYTITLSENGTPTEPTTQTSTTYKLPTALAEGSCQDDTKELVGWSTVAIPNPGDMPTSKFYELGETVTLSEDKTTFYAVFATPTTIPGGTEEKEVVTTLDFSNQGYENQQEVTSLTIGEVTVTFNKGSNNNAPKYYNTGTAVRVYGGGYFTVSSKNITKIAITTSTGEDSNAISADCGTYDTNNKTWTGSAQSVKFTVGGTTGHRRIKSVKVTYTTTVQAEDIVTYSNYSTTCVPAPKLVSIAQTAGQIEFTEGDEFVKATITATYEDESTKDVTSKAIFSTPDMTQVGEQTISVSYKEGEVTAETSYKINIKEKPKYTITWWANGEEFYTQTDVEGTTIEVPTTSPEAATYACDDKVFVGWVDAEISGGTNIEPTFITDFDKITENKDYFAVFATETSVGIESTIHTLTPSNSWSGYEEGTIKDDKDLTWSYCAGGQQTSGVYSLNLRNKNTEISYIASPVFAANVKNIKATIVNGSASNARKVYICSEPTSLPTTGDLGTTEVQGGHNGELSLSFEGTMTQFYIQVSDALQFQSIVVEVGATTTYSGYVTTCEATTEALSGKFSTGKYEYAEFATGNLQYKPSTDTWRFAKQQYQYVGEANINVGDPNYKGWIDMFGWSVDGKFGVNPSCNKELYTGDFVDWGTQIGEGWLTLTETQWNYLLNTRPNHSTLKQIAMVGETRGIMLFPDNWTGTTVEPTYDDELKVYVYKYNLVQWADLEAKGVIFLPAAGRRFGGYGNTYGVDGTTNTGAEYKIQYKTNYFACYWTSTKHNDAGAASYLFNYATSGDSYKYSNLNLGWYEYGHAGHSVRLAKVSSTLVEIGSDDNREVIEANAGQKVNVQVNRTFKANDGYYTICLPFDLDAEKIGKALQISSITENVAEQGMNVVFTEVTNLVAGQPYLLLPSEDLTNPIFEGVTIANTTGETTEPVFGAGIKITLTGIINGGGQTDGSTEYYVGDYGCLYNGSTAKLGLRAFFTITDDTDQPVKVRARVVVGENTTTGVDNSQLPITNIQKVIENGQLIIIRNGEKFNAQGQKL